MAELNRNRTGAPRSPQRTWAEQDGRPGFPARGTHQRPRVRLSVRKAALKFANATKLNRKSGAAHESFCDINEQMQADKGKQSKHIVFGPGTLWRTWGTRPVPIGPAMTQTPTGPGLSVEFSRRTLKASLVVDGAKTIQRPVWQTLLHQSEHSAVPSPP
jgi:hypothetical protein